MRFFDTYIHVSYVRNDKAIHFTNALMIFETIKTFWYFSDFNTGIVSFQITKLPVQMKAIWLIWYESHDMSHMIPRYDSRRCRTKAAVVKIPGLFYFFFWNRPKSSRNIFAFSFADLSFQNHAKYCDCPISYGSYDMRRTQLVHGPWQYSLQPFL